MRTLTNAQSKLGGVAVALLSATLILLSVSVSAWADNAALKVRIGAHADFTRFVLELEKPSAYRLLTLRDPYRIVIDLPDVKWAAPGSAADGAGGGLIRKYRFGQFRAGVSRFVLDLAAPAAVKAHFLLGPDSKAGHRLVLDLTPSNASAFAAALGSVASPDWSEEALQAAAPREPEVRAPVRGNQGSETPVRTIVLDPGHGGVDPGAIGSSGVYEKSIVLAFAKSLRQRLQKRGRYRVVLTREKDFYIPLRKRYEIAHSYEADLFISVHADAHKTSSIRGFSVYTLSEKASDKEAAALAAKENKSDILAGYDLSEYDDQTSFILLDLAQRKTSEASWQFAQSLVTNMARDIRLLRRPHRFAGFAVLKSPTVPSVLVELGYLSNRQEERNLRTTSYRDKLADAMVRAIEAYFNQQDLLSRS